LVFGLFFACQPAHGIETYTNPTPYQLPESEPPGHEESTEIVRTLLEKVQANTLSAQWLRAHVQPMSPSVPPSEGWYALLKNSLSTQQPLGKALQNSSDILRTVDGPDYTRVILGTKPLISIVLRQNTEKQAVIHTLGITTCLLCSEASRWVRDALYMVQQQGPNARRLFPGQDLNVDAHVKENRLGEPWAHEVTAYLHQTGLATQLLTNAQVIDAQERTVRLQYSDGREDQWTLGYANGSWHILYSLLPPESPLRVPRSVRYKLLQRPYIAKHALENWVPTWRAHESRQAIQIGHRSIGAIADPVDQTILIALLDMDRALAGVVRVDPQSQSVIQRWPIEPPAARSNLPIDGWYSRWRVSLSPDGHLLAMALPYGITVLNLITGKQHSISHSTHVSTFAWRTLEKTGQHELVVGQTDGKIRFFGERGERRTQIRSAPLALRFSGAEGMSISERGTVSVFDTTHGSKPQQVGTSCCGMLSDAAFSDDNALGMAVCGPQCGNHFSVITTDPVSLAPLPGAGTHSTGASISPDNRWATAGAAGVIQSLSLWSLPDRRPLVEFGDQPIFQVSWQSNSESIVTTDVKGYVWLWDLDSLLGLPTEVSP
jgi:hypothetical protein